MWNHRHPGRAGSFEPGTPWLLRYFDRITFYPVTAAELADLRADMAAGRGHVDITDGEFSLAGYRRFLAANPDGIAAFRRRQAVAFAAERRAWATSGELAEPRVSSSGELAPFARVPIDASPGICLPWCGSLSIHRSQ